VHQLALEAPHFSDRKLGFAVCVGFVLVIKFLAFGEYIGTVISLDWYYYDWFAPISEFVTVVTVSVVLICSLAFSDSVTSK
jgi:hypothetical protein